MTLKTDFAAGTIGVDYDQGMAEVAEELQTIIRRKVQPDLQVEVVERDGRPSILKIVAPSPDVSKDCFQFLKGLKVKAQSFPGLTLASCISCDGQNLVVPSSLAILREHMASLTVALSQTGTGGGAAPAARVA